MPFHSVPREIPDPPPPSGTLTTKQVRAKVIPRPNYSGARTRRPSLRDTLEDRRDWSRALCDIPCGCCFFTGPEVHPPPGPLPHGPGLEM